MDIELHKQETGYETYYYAEIPFGLAGPYLTPENAVEGATDILNGGRGVVE